ncbi:hypothetical protein ACQKNS_25190 [Peribacillus sp. NPDC094092]
MENYTLEHKITCISLFNILYQNGKDLTKQKLSDHYSGLSVYHF